MTSHSRTCYQTLSDYSKNGMVPIVAPTPVETIPEIFKRINPRNFSQNEYNAQVKMYGINEKKDEKKDCLPYVTRGKLKELCGGDKTEGEFSMQYNFLPGFNEVGVNKFYT